MKIIVRVCVARIRRNVKLIHFNEIQSEANIITRSGVERPCFHSKCNWIIAVDKELWIMYKNAIFQRYIGEKNVNLVFVIVWSNVQRQVKGVIYTTPRIGGVLSQHIFGQID